MVWRFLKQILELAKLIETARGSRTTDPAAAQMAQ